MSGMDVKDLPGGMPAEPSVAPNSPVTGQNGTKNMFQRVKDSKGQISDALILRRFTPNWAAPDDHKVNPWDLNEPNPTDGTLLLIPARWARFRTR